VADLTRQIARWRVPLGFACGPVAYWLARPTWTSLAAGYAFVFVGEGLRVWAAGHLEKGREVTRSGPYRFVAHPLYLGSSIMGAGMAIASASVAVALLTGAYMAATMIPAIRAEEAWLRATFGEQYDAYRETRTAPSARRFSLARAIANHEYRAVAGLGLVAGLLALKIGWR
jgi:protein-S-isoprenylcysteine O-methyltransferase Ste14